ncbi:phosphoglycerate mutase [Candidatus Pacearchaeota archaeon]|nr:phosphoglycerate mutase [Candidatus Pacearchaeota archaeon]
MKGIFVILDGASDTPCPFLGNKTPLEAANTPNLDEIARKSKIDYCYPVKENVAPQSSNAVVSLLGYDPAFAPRGPLEAAGSGIKLKRGDLALRTNFATLKDLSSLAILDRRAGRTLSTKEAKLLARAINSEVKLPYKFEFYATVQHRGVLVFRGGFSDNITNVDPAYGTGLARSALNSKLKFSHPIDDEEDSKLSSELLNNFVRQSFKVLDSNPINIARAKKGYHRANVLLCRDPGNFPVKFKKLKGKWLALGYMPLEIGIAKAAGMDVYRFWYPKLKSTDVYANLHYGLKQAVKYSLKMIKKYRKKYDYFYIHLKETDIPGHDNKPNEKVKMIEYIDSYFFYYLKKWIQNNKLIITADHTTSCQQKVHTADPVPVLTYPFNPKQKEQRFTEEDAKKGRKIIGRKLLEENFF